MERLTEQQRESVKKLSTERLRVNLIRADYAEDEVMKMDRQMLMETWAKLVGLGKTGPTGVLLRMIQSLRKKGWSLRK